MEHLIGSEKMWIQQIIFGTDIKRIRDKEFEKRKRSIQDLLKEYSINAKSTKNLLSTKLEDENLFENRERTKGEKITVFWALSHVLEHNYYHIGQINLLIALVGQIKEY